ncbi:hypothetical protein ABT158_49795 [Nonomuraea sp. NPDC001636]|uniref:hypothetical protein n=1 Tax=Nonomuraea sp. NPDC001636 TaxID=3154391 RepID=UPI0033300782
MRKTTFAELDSVGAELDESVLAGVNGGMPREMWMDWSYWGVDNYVEENLAPGEDPMVY